jgi:RNA-binding protein PNO1
VSPSSRARSASIARCVAASRVHPETTPPPPIFSAPRGVGPPRRSPLAFLRLLLRSLPLLPAPFARFYLQVNVPANRFTPLKENWMALYEPVTKQMKIDLRMNLKTKKVELKTTKETEDEGALQKSADFVQAFLLGFEVQDAVALLRLDDLYLECFEVKDVKQTLKGEHMSRGIGRLAGKSGKTKFTIENATRTRIVIADQHIRILGSFQNIKIARDALCNLILGSPPGKVYSKLRSITARLAERF